MASSRSVPGCIDDVVNYAFIFRSAPVWRSHRRDQSVWRLRVFSIRTPGAMSKFLVTLMIVC
jgi:hypothetical protein